MMLTFAISLQSLPPIFDKIAKDIALSNSQAGTLMGIYAIPGVFLPLFIAFLANKYNKKSMIIVSLIILIAGLVSFSLSGSFSTLLISRLASGIGATVLVVLAPLLVTMFFGQKNMGIAMGIFNVAVPLGTVISANLFGVLGEKVHWRSIILGIGIFSGIVLLAVALGLFLPTNKDKDGANISEKPSKGLFSNVNLWLLALIWMLGNFQLLSYVTFAPQYYQISGLSIQRAGLLNSFIMFVPIIITPFIVILIDKTGWKKRLILFGSILIAISFILISRGTSTPAIWAITLGFGFAPLPVCVFSLLPELVHPNQTGMGLGIITIASNLGIAIGPSAFGLLLDKTGENFTLGFIVLSLIPIIIILALSRLKRERAKI